VKPKTEKALPRRAKLLKDKLEPTLIKSSTDNEDPRRAKLRREKDDPM
jgi:hypothetical protein